jgi:hypothetical protein
MSYETSRSWNYGMWITLICYTRAGWICITVILLVNKTWKVVDCHYGKHHKSLIAHYSFSLTKQVQTTPTAQFGTNEQTTL